MKPVYRWRAGGWNVDPQVAGDRLETLRQRANAPLTAKLVLSDARSAASPLHPAFEWDDVTAAEAHRESQAGALMRDIQVVVERPGYRAPSEMRAFVNIQQDGERGYTSLKVAMSDAELRKQVVDAAWRELEAWREKYRAYSELAAVFAAIDAQPGRKPD